MKDSGHELDRLLELWKSELELGDGQLTAMRLDILAAEPTALTPEWWMDQFAGLQTVFQMTSPIRA